jgi:hypothetical protein
LKRKPLFSFSRKAKINENSLTFRESFRENFRFRDSFREKFLFPGWFSRKVSVFAQIFNQGFGSGIQVAHESGSAFHMENVREKFRKTDNFRKNFHENENIRENAKNENFRFNPIDEAKFSY